MLSQSLIQDRWLAALARIARGTIVFVSPSGQEWTFSGPATGPRARFHIHEWAVLERLQARGDIGFGEDYIAGAWETDDLEDLVTLFLLNIDVWESYGQGNLFNRLVFAFQKALAGRNDIAGARRNIQAHYDVGNAFYGLWLDETMTYSSALFDGATQTLAEAQRRKYGRVLSRFAEDDSSILEIGCGWGGFAEQAADHGHRVTGLTISPAQHGFATARLGTRADIRLEDFRRVEGKFDNIVSIEMLEAVGEHNWPRYFRIVADRMARGGRAVIQTIVVRDDIFAQYRRSSDFIRHYVFPGGMLPSLSRLREEVEGAGLKLVDTLSFGQDYARTLRVWTARMKAREDDIRALGHDDKFLRNWQFYLGFCTAAFAVKRIGVVQLELAHA